MVYDLIDILEESVKWNGVMPLTNKHLLNILKMLISNRESSADPR